MNRALYRLFFVCCFLSPFTIHAQNVPRVESLSQLDGETQGIAALITGKLRSLGGAPRIRTGLFTLEGAESPLGDYWSRQLTTALASPANRNYVLLDNSPGTSSPGTRSQGTAVQADYTLAGEILRFGDTLRIYTRLIRQQDASVVEGWNTDFILTPFMDEMARINGDSSNVRRDMYENDSREAPLRVESGASWISRTIHRDDEDWFAFNGWGKGILVLEADGDLDTYMELYDAASGDLLTEDDDGGDNVNARIEFLNDEGKDYMVKVRGYDRDETGSYRFRASLEGFPEDPSEPNDTRLTAFSIEPGETADGFFHTSSDEDWYRIFIPAGDTRLLLYTQGQTDTQMALYDNGGTLIAEDDDSGYDGNARISATLPQGTVFLQVKAYGGQRGRYTLETRIREGGRPDPWENDDTPSGAKEISAGASQERTFTDPDDVDWVRFRVIEAGTYEIRARAAGDELDPYIELFDDRENSLDEDDDGGEHYDARLRVELSPGIYLLKLHALNDEPPENASYTLSITR